MLSPPEPPSAKSQAAAYPSMITRSQSDTSQGVARPDGLGRIYSYAVSAIARVCGVLFWHWLRLPNKFSLNRAGLPPYFIRVALATNSAGTARYARRIEPPSPWRKLIGFLSRPRLRPHGRFPARDPRRPVWILRPRTGRNYLDRDVLGFDRGWGCGRPLMQL